LNQLKKSRVNGSLSEEECRVIMRKLISGLKDLFDFDIVHRDLKLPNVLLHFPSDHDASLLNINLQGGGSGGDLETRRQEYLSKLDLTRVPFEIRIADFGFSKYLEDAKHELTGTICGTPLYMSP